jgi:hypothetical protein
MPNRKSNRISGSGGEKRQEARAGRSTRATRQTGASTRRGGTTKPGPSEMEEYLGERGGERSEE